MTKFLLFVLLGIAAVAVWGWLRWHRHSKKPVTESPSPISPRTAEQKSVEPPDDVVAETAQTSGRDASIRDAPSVNADASSTESPPSDTRQQMPSPDSSFVLPDQVSTPSEVSDSEGFPEHQLAEQDTAALSPGSDENELEEAAITQEQPAVTEAKTTTPSSEVGCKSSEADRPQDKTSEETIQTALQPDAATDTLSTSPDIPATKIAAKPAVDTMPETTSQTKPPEYRPLAPVSSATPSRPGRSVTNRQPRNTSLELWLQLAFGRDGGVKTLALVPERREGMPSQIEMGESRLCEWSDDHYESVVLANIGEVLRQGVVWQGRGDARRWRWTLSGRELYVLASGDVGGLYPFGSSPRLLLNANHAVLTTVGLRQEAEAGLVAAGCANFVVLDDSTPGVPPGWLLFRDVEPTRAVPMHDGAHILNALCPLPDIKPHYIGGIRLNRQTWLAGFPPRIRFTGTLGDDFRVTMDSQPAQLAADGAFEAPGWDVASEHRLLFGGKTDTYVLRTMDENWEMWPAYDFGTGVVICGASTHHIEGARWRQVRVPVGNPLLVGARPGEIFHCPMRANIHCEVLTILAPFNPVWALPFDPTHADKSTARIVLLHSIQPITSAELTNGKPVANRVLKAWFTAINDAGRKQLALATESDDVKNLWRRYRAVAKQLWRKMRES